MFVYEGLQQHQRNQTAAEEEKPFEHMEERLTQFHEAPDVAHVVEHPAQIHNQINDENDNHELNGSYALREVEHSLVFQLHYIPMERVSFDFVLLVLAQIPVEQSEVMGNIEDLLMDDGCAQHETQVGQYPSDEGDHGVEARINYHLVAEAEAVLSVVASGVTETILVQFDLIFIFFHGHGPLGQFAHMSLRRERAR